MTINPENFTLFRKALDRGDFKKLHRNTKECVDIWKEQYKRCTEGFSVGGVKMSGRLYSYVNFGTIELEKPGSAFSYLGPPELRDIEWIVFGNIEIAIEQNLDLLWLSGRRGGKSFCLAWNAVYPFIFHRTGKSLVGAADSGKLQDVFDKVRNHLNGLSNTEFYRSRSKDSPNDHIVSGYRKKTKSGFLIEGNEGIIYRIVYEKHTDGVGKAANFIGLDEVGMFKNFSKVLGSNRPCMMRGTSKIGFTLATGTGGDTEQVLEAERVFNDPVGYKMLAFYDGLEPKSKKNIYIPKLPFDLNRTIENPCCLFTPGFMCLNQFKNSDGFTITEDSKNYIIKEREVLKKAKDIEPLLQYIQFWPLKVEDVFLSSSNNIFPLALLQDWLDTVNRDNKLRTCGIRGELDFCEGKLKFTPDSELREAEFPVTKTSFKKGCIVIYEFPFSVNGIIPDSLYIAGTDPYAQDYSKTSPSLGATYIYKRIYNADKTYDLPVASYIGRPDKAEDYYERVRKLLIFYNAKCLHENNVAGMKQYFETVKSLRYLCGQPNIVNDIIIDPTVKRTHGICITIKMKNFLLETIRSWLLTEFAPNRYNVEKILDVNLLKELLVYNTTDNFDRVIAFGLCLIQDLEMFRLKVKELSGPPELGFGKSIFNYYGI